MVTHKKNGGLMRWNFCQILLSQPPKMNGVLLNGRIHLGDEEKKRGTTAVARATRMLLQLFPTASYTCVYKTSIK